MKRTSRRQSKRTKTTATSGSPDPGSASALPKHLIPFQTGPSLERIPDDVLNDILSYLPPLDPPPASGSSHFKLVREPVLCALSRTSRLLRSRCLVMAWHHVHLCNDRIPMRTAWTEFRTICEATKASIRILMSCPHLWPMIRTVSVTLTRYQADEVVPTFAACLAAIPNLTTIQVIYATDQMTAAIKSGFEGYQFPSVRRISLPSSAHEIVKCCPNVEEVTCLDENGSTIIGSLAKGLVKLLPDLKYLSVPVWTYRPRSQLDTKTLAAFSGLDTIEFIVSKWEERPLGEVLAQEIKEASRILKENKSHAEKTVIATQWRPIWDDARFEFDIKEEWMTRQVTKL